MYTILHSIYVIIITLNYSIIRKIRISFLFEKIHCFSVWLDGGIDTIKIDKIFP